MMKTKNRAHGPSPAVAQGARHLAGVGGRQAYLYSCRKAGAVIALESHAERTIAQLADLDPRVVALRAQPCTIDVETGRRFETRAELLEARHGRVGRTAAARDYTPDFRLHLADGASWFVEGKDPRYAANDVYWGKVAKAALHFRAAGENFAIVRIPRGLEAPLVFNAALLASVQGRLRTDPAPLLEPVARACAGGATTLGDVAAACRLDLREAPRLFLVGLLSADLCARPIGAALPVAYAAGDLSSLELLPLGGSQP